ncbi:MAG: EAL domain-containing protein [Gammaproteobacteria bacterium]|nr:MAG: EAL domain-containing protein [Gammaproteobacteria bacterium]
MFLHRLPLRLRFILVILLVTAIILALAIGGMAQVALKLAESQGETRLQQIMGVLSQDLIRAEVFADPSDTANLMRKLRSFTGLHHLYLFRNDGTAVLAYHAPGQPEPRQAPAANGPALTAHGGYLVARQPLRFEGQNHGIAWMELERPEPRALLLRMLRDSGWLVPLLLLVAWYLAARLQRPLTAPIMDLTRFLQQVARRGDYSRRIHTREGHELGELYQGVNALLETIEQTRDALYRHSEQLERTLQAITDGILTLDRNGQIVTANAAARRLLGLADVSDEDLPSADAVCLLRTDDPEPLALPGLIAGLPEGGRLGDLRLCRPDGSQQPVEVQLTTLHDARGACDGWLLTLTPISEEQQLRQQIEQLARIDRLTGLMNRSAFERRLETLLAEGVRLQVLHLDIDRFKLVNETASHSEGDRLLRQLGALLASRMPERALLARLGSDEFGVLIPDMTEDELRPFLEHLLRSVRQFEYHIHGQRLPITLSIGVATANGQTDLATLLRNADTSRQIAKQAGGNRYHIYRANDERLIEHQNELMLYSRLVEALEQRRIEPWFQRIVPLQPQREGEWHIEVLSRLLCADGSLLSPALFVPVAERYRLAPAFDRLVIEAVFDWFRRHPQQALRMHKVSINLSGQSLDDPQVAETIEQQLARGPLRGAQICFEFTETAAIQSLDAAVSLMDSLRRHGCQFSLDDFGTSMSSLAYLKQFPVDYLKLDGSFVRDIEHDAIDFALVRAFNDIGHTLGMRTIAEFVENDTIRNMLASIGIDFVQGYGIHKPEPLDRLAPEQANQAA